MSSLPYPGPYPTTVQQIVEHFAAPVVRRHAKPSSQLVRRRPTAQQGHALELLGHAIEYIADSQLYISPEGESKSESDAIQLLMRLNREVFAECREIVPVRRRLKQRLMRPFAVRPQAA